MILSAQTIADLCLSDQMMVHPYCSRTVQNGMSYGISACGYDVRANFEHDAEFLRLPSGKFALAVTAERFNMPFDVMGVVHDKSTWARQGLALQNTVIEPGWHGYLTLELTNHGPRTLIIERNDPIGQIVFHRLDHPTQRPYTGKYQDQPARPVRAIEESS